MIPKINSAHGSDTRNIINTAIDSINMQGKSIQDLVADGQLTPTQYATLIKYINNMAVKSEVRENTNTHPINVAEMDTETKKLFTGGSVAVVGEDAVGTENLKMSSVSTAILNPSIYDMLYTDVDSYVANLSDRAQEIPSNNTIFNRDKFKESGVLKVVRMAVAVGGDITVKLFSRNKDNTYNLVYEFPLTVKSGVNTFVSGKDFPEMNVKKGWYLAYHSTTARLWAYAGGDPGSYLKDGENVVGNSNNMNRYALTAQLTYTIARLKTEIEQMKLEDIEDKNDLFKDAISETTQEITMNNDGTVKRVFHNGLDGKVKRWDSFRYFSNEIIENRMTDRKNIIELNYDLVNYSTTIVEKSPPQNELNFDNVDWLEWSRAPNAIIENGNLKVIGEGDYNISQVPFNVKTTTKYGILVNVIENTITNVDGLKTGYFLTGVQTTLVPPEKIGYFKLVLTTANTGLLSFLPIGLSSGATSGHILIGNIYALELPSESQIDYDFAKLNADELIEKYI